MAVDNSAIEAGIRTVVADRGAELIECRFLPGAGGVLVRCLADYPGGGITLDVCSAINRGISFYLEKIGAFNGSYSVEVNSPGLDRKLKTGDDFRRVCGKEVMLWLNCAGEGKQYIEGKIISVNTQGLRLKIREKEADIGFDRIITGKEKIIFD